MEGGPVRVREAKGSWSVAIVDPVVHRFGDVDKTVQLKAPGIATIDPDDQYGHGTLVTGIIVG